MSQIDSEITDVFGYLRDAVDTTETYIRHLVREKLMAELDAEETNFDYSDILPNEAETPEVERLERIRASMDASFAADIVEPKGNNWELIDRRIRGVGALGWTWEKRYERNGQFAWCGAEEAEHLGAAGLLPDIRKRVMPSCYRLHKFCVRDDPKKRRLVRDIRDARFGDLVIVGPADGKSYGAHITAFLELDEANGRVFLHEGNAKAYGPNGDYREGVGRRWRNLARSSKREYTPMWIYRFLDEDFEPLN